MGIGALLLISFLNDGDGDTYSIGSSIGSSWIKTNIKKIKYLFVVNLLLTGIFNYIKNFITKYVYIEFIS